MTDSGKNNSIKASEKLQDVITRGIGKIGKKENDKGRQEDIIITEVPAGDTKENELRARISERIIFRESKRQMNVENINKVATGQFSPDDTVTSDHVNDDWLSRFYNIVEDISDTAMQGLWGRILAAEVVQPGTFSLRTLEILKNMSQREASVFIRFAALALQAGATSFVINPDNSEFLTREYNISFNDRMILEEAGLINSNDLFYTLRGHGKTPFEFGKLILLVERGNNCPEQSVPVLAFTKAGAELRKLIKQPLDIKYFNRFARLFADNDVRVSYANIISRNGPDIIYSNPAVNLPSE